jgi:hypothetical protein
MFPFTQAKQIEVVISRVVPQRPAGSSDCAPESTKHAFASADKDTNIGFLFSLLGSGWAREHCILSNGGVFQMAQERFESRHFPFQLIEKNISAISRSFQILESATWPLYASRLCQPGHSLHQHFTPRGKFASRSRNGILCVTRIVLV